MRNRAFTLIELLVAIVIIGILVGVAIPMMKIGIKKAILAEAVAGLGTVRLAEEWYFAERKEYLDTATAGDITLLPNINPGDLNGTYISEECYSVHYVPTYPVPATTYIIYCDLTRTQAPKEAYVKRVFEIEGGSVRVIMMNEEGRIATQGLGNVGYHIIKP